MQVEFAFLADAAVASGEKLHILGGGIEEIRAGHFPAIHPSLALVLSINLHRTECDRSHTLEIELTDADGKAVGPPVTANFMVPSSTLKPGRSAHVGLVLNIVQTTFQKAGNYAFEITVDGHHLKSVPLYLDQLPPPEQPSAAQ